MAISLKNHEDRLVALESKRCEAKLILDNPIELRAGYSRSVIDCKCDWTLYDFVIVGWNIWGPGEDGGRPENSECDFATIPVAYLVHGFYFSHYEIYGSGSLSTEDVKVAKYDNNHLSFWTDRGRGRITWIFLVKN